MLSTVIRANHLPVPSHRLQAKASNVGRCGSADEDVEDNLDGLRDVRLRSRSLAPLAESLVDGSPAEAEESEAEDLFASVKRQWELGGRDGE